MDPIFSESEILTVLDNIKDGRSHNVADILFGSQNYPITGTDGDHKIRAIEEELAKRDFVIITEKGGTNKTINGYAHFTISPTGTQHLRANSQQSTRILFALSTTASDAQLISRGLTNLGLLGYLETTPNSETSPLQEYNLTFPKGQAYFYTLDETKETFDKLNAQRLQSLGFARKTPATQYRQLHRFFNKKDQYHIFVVNPNFAELISADFRDESNDNPIFISSQDRKESQPLFLYSNTSKIYSTTLPFELNDGDSDSTNEPNSDFFKAAFNTIIKQENVNISMFFLKSEEDTDLTVSVNDTVHNFYVNAQDGGVYTVRRNPTPPGESSILTDVSSWKEVERLFREWLTSLPTPDLRKKHDKDSQEGNQEQTKPSETTAAANIYENSDISIGDSFEIEPAFGVETLANEIVKIIKNLKPEPGNMIGIFARWGRGKTRLMNEIWTRLSSEVGPVRYHQVKYQAWRYQDTPASWAYLYEQFSDGYLGKKKNIKGFFKYHWRLFWLNVEREGWWSLILAILFAIASIAGVMFWTPLRETFQTLGSKIGWSIGGGLILAVSIKNFRQAYLTKAINIISKYGVKTSFKNTLGIQAEIQKELVYLIKAWIADGAKQKILLRVDDLDRCSEEKTIEIIDALRIILDDEELKEKLLVLTAIDERILRSAINKKYEQFEGDTEIAREYVDKLFIFSVKLGALDQRQSKEFFEKLVKNEVELPKPTTSKGDTFDQFAGQAAKTPQPRNEPSPKADQSTADAQEATAATKSNRIKKLSGDEVTLITNNLGLIKNSTPRKIRILYYRYLFAKNLIIIGNGNSEQNDYWLSDAYHEHFIKLLIYFSDQDTKHIVEQIVLASANDPVKSPLDSTTFDKIHYVRLLKILELTIAY